MGHLYLVRHGQASFGADDYDQLSALGHRQSVRLGEYFAQQGLHFDAVIIGTLKRHQQTLAGILEGMQQASEPLAWPGLNEYDSEAVIAAIHPQPLQRPDTPELYRQHFRLLRDGLAQWMAGVVSPHGMPPYPDFVAGVTSALDHVRAQHAGQTTIELNLRIRNTSVTQFAFTPKRHMLVSYNGIAHLEGDPWRDWVTYA
jgi:broad specificity phosphatase PhoE